MARVAADFSIRRAALADAAAVAHVHRESWRTTYAGILPRELVAQETGRKAELVWQQRLARAVPDAATWIAETAREGVVGFASCGGARAPIEGLEAEIYALYVIQSHQRRGVGRELVRACARHFVRQGLFGFHVWVLKANHARLFYEALGGQEVATKSERLGLHRYDQIAYGWHDLTALVAP
ncbi:MAG TPA: GNAT family N-acetyltransferase [Usitatibacter sp.]|nr:GNAT family N-acetyltransferase [Usitatibacter sp.]